MDNQEILDRLNTFSPPENDYLVFQAVPDNCYFGKDKYGQIVFMRKSNFEKLSPVCQETKSLRLLFNDRCSIIENGQCLNATMHILVCKTLEIQKVEAFIRLSTAFVINEAKDDDPYNFSRLFSLICSLFDKDCEISDIELQGLFAELYTIIYFNNIGCDLDKYWQSKSKMKFDFSIDEKKRLEVKSTIKASRTHHFKHEQLLSQLYDIKVVSIMMQKNDRGLCLMDMISEVRFLYPQNFELMYHIDAIASHISEDVLQKTRYDSEYLKNNIRFFDAINIPHFYEKSPDGVYNAEYDCGLDNIICHSADEIVAWIEGSKNV